MFLVVGQGNPGEAYARTRHNVGFMVLDRLGLPFRKKGEALVAEARGGLFVKPLTYYNLTGRVVAPLARFYKIPPGEDPGGPRRDGPAPGPPPP
jgi:PTH1 family peptidyl-tRNA hydrolase